MKKIYTFFFLLLTVVVVANADVTPIITGTKIVTRGSQVTDLSTISTSNYYLLSTNGYPDYCFYEYETTSDNVTKHYIGGQSVSNLTTAALVKITPTTANNTTTYTIQAASGNYYQKLTTNTVETGDTAANYTITAVSNTSLFLISNSSLYLNNNNGPTLSHGASGTWNYSRVAIYEANITDAATVTWNISGYTTKPSAIVTIGSKASSVEPPHAFSTLSYEDKEVTTDITIDATATIGELPFKASTKNDTTWYYIKSVQTSTYLYYNSSDNTTTPLGTGQDIEAHQYQWAFIGNPIDGYQVLNRAAGANRYMYYNKPSGIGQRPVMEKTQQDPAWTLYEGKTVYDQASKGQFSFGYNGYYWNVQTQLSFWSGNGIGNAWTAEKVPTYNELVTSNIKPYYDATGYFALTESAKNELKTAGYDPDKTDDYTSDDYTAIKTKLDELLADNSNFNYPTDGYYRIKSSGNREWGVSYIGVGNNNQGRGNKATGYGLKTVTSYASDASTVLHLNRTSTSDYTYTISAQNEWAIDASDHNSPILLTTEQGSAINFTFAPVINNANYVGYCTIAQVKQYTNGDGTHFYFHEATWGANQAAVVVWDNSASTVSSFWKIEDISEDEAVYTGNLSRASDGYYASAYLPFPYTLNNGVKAYIGTVGNANSVITLEEVTTVPANTGVILYSELVDGSSDNTIPFTCKLASEPNESKGSLSGVTVATAYTSSDYYLGISGGYGGTVGLYKVNSSSELTNKAYLLGSQVSPSKGFAFAFGDDDPTGINGASAENGGGLDVNAPMYNLQGVRVPTWYKGIVVQNGQKYLLK